MSLGTSRGLGAQTLGELRLRGRGARVTENSARGRAWGSVRPFSSRAGTGDVCGTRGRAVPRRPGRKAAREAGAGPGSPRARARVRGGRARRRAEGRRRRRLGRGRCARWPGAAPHEPAAAPLLSRRSSGAARCPLGRARPAASAACSLGRARPDAARPGCRAGVRADAEMSAAAPAPERGWKSEKVDEAQALARSCAARRPDFQPCDGLSICATHSHGKCFKLHWCCHLGWCHCKSSGVSAPSFRGRGGDWVVAVGLRALRGSWCPTPGQGCPRLGWAVPWQRGGWRGSPAGATSPAKTCWSWTGWSRGVCLTSCR